MGLAVYQFFVLLYRTRAFLRGMQHRLRRVAHDLFGRFVEVVSDPLVDHAEKPVHEKGA